MAKISDLPINERKYYRLVRHHADMVVGGYENAAMDGELEVEPDIEQIMLEAWGEAEIDLENSRNQQLHFIGKDRMNSLLRTAAKNALKDANF